MKPILVVYGTTEGHTRKIGEFVTERLRAAGKAVDLIDSATPQAREIPLIYAGAFILGSVHFDRHQSALVHFVKENLGWLNAIPTAFFSVNLNMTHRDPEARAEAQKCLDGFLEETGLKPHMARPVAGALKYTQYDYFKRALLHYLVRPGGVKASATPDVEYTDWKEVGRFVDEYLEATQSPGR